MRSAAFTISNLFLFWVEFLNDSVVICFSSHIHVEKHHEQPSENSIKLAEFWTKIQLTAEFLGQHFHQNSLISAHSHNSYFQKKKMASKFFKKSDQKSRLDVLVSRIILWVICSLSTFSGKKADEHRILQKYEQNSDQKSSVSQLLV